MTYLVIAAFAAILASLGAALYFMMKPGEEGAPKSARMARALALRVGFSVLLFICLLVAWKLGWIAPTGIRPGQ